MSESEQGHGVAGGEPQQDKRTQGRFLGKWSNVALMVLAGAIAVGGVLAWQTSDATGSLLFLRQQGGVAAQQKTIVDETPWQTAQVISALAVTQEELGYAHDAQRLADHEVDQAFATELRRANLRQKTLTGAALEAQKKVKMLEGLVASDQAAVKALAGKDGDDADVAQAQLGLDQDELNDAREDLARASGDDRGEIQQELTAREAEMKKYDASGGGTGEMAAISVKRYRTLAGLIGAWERQKQRTVLLQEAKNSAERDAATLTVAHNALEAQSSARQLASPEDSGVATDRVAGLKRMGMERQLLSIYGDRIATEQRLSDVYGKWAVQVALQHRILQHLIVVQVLWIAVILVVAILLSALARRLAGRESLDKRRTRTLGWIAQLAVQVLALLSILLVVFGPPNQLSTVIGLVTAGLTVALQDFILAFVGWFILMGRNGIGVGDVVEINSVAGEVVDIGLFRTTLLETGNWTAKGHPTGRRVAFNNKYAISGQFFNFSTAGQWMWDELAVPMAAADAKPEAIERVQKTVTSETEADARQAEAEWKQVSQRHGLSQFSAESAVNLRPSATGVDLVVRYVTRATGRFERKNTLYRCVSEALHAPAVEAGAAA